MDDQSAEKRTASDDERYEAFVRLLVEHEPRVRSFLRGLLPTWHEVEEVTQEASLIAWRKFDDFHTWRGLTKLPCFPRMAATKSKSLK